MDERDATGKSARVAGEDRFENERKGILKEVRDEGRRKEGTKRERSSSCVATIAFNSMPSYHLPCTTKSLIHSILFLFTFYLTVCVYMYLCACIYV